MIDILKKIAELANEVGPKEGSWRPDYDDLERFLEEVSDLIPMEIWDDVALVEITTKKCTICHGNGFVQEYSVREDDYGRTWIEDCVCVVEYEAQLEEQYQAYLAEKSAKSERMEDNSEANVEKVN